MKRVLLAVLALVLCVNLGSAQDVLISQKHLAPRVKQLTQYLELSMDQQDDVKSIVRHFIQKQKRCDEYDGKRRVVRRQKAMYEHLAQMRAVLNPQQYKKYLIMVNMTNSTYVVDELTNVSDVYLTENK